MFQILYLANHFLVVFCHYDLKDSSKIESVSYTGKEYLQKNPFDTWKPCKMDSTVNF